MVFSTGGYFVFSVATADWVNHRAHIENAYAHDLSAANDARGSRAIAGKNSTVEVI